MYVGICAEDWSSSSMIVASNHNALHLYRLVSHEYKAQHQPYYQLLRRCCNVILTPMFRQGRAGAAPPPTETAPLSCRVITRPVGCSLHTAPRLKRSRRLAHSALSLAGPCRRRAPCRRQFGALILQDRSLSLPRLSAGPAKCATATELTNRRNWLAHEYIYMWLRWVARKSELCNQKVLPDAQFWRLSMFRTFSCVATT